MSDSNSSLSSTYELLPAMDVFVEAPSRPRYWVNILLLGCTCFTTLLVGARLQYCFDHNLPPFPDTLAMSGLFPLQWVVQYPARLLLGIPFCASLMLILLVHEMGHYLFCRYYGVKATLPYFIPAPTLIGTWGAFIRIKSPIRSRAALFDIGIAGPIAGFVAATITLFFALAFSKPLAANVAGTSELFDYPLIFQLMQWLVRHLGLGPFSFLGHPQPLAMTLSHWWNRQLGMPGPTNIPLDFYYLHPVAIAAWIGMFATALNLLPGGQLDGGHIIYATWPRAHRWISLTTFFFLLCAAFAWSGWLVWAVVVLVTGFRHPPVPAEPGLTPARRRLLVVAICMLALTFMVMPLRGYPLGDLLRSLRDLFHA